MRIVTFKRIKEFSTKNPEADELLAMNGGKAFEDEFFAGAYLTGFLQEDINIKKMGSNAADFIDSQPIASDVIVEQILKLQKQ